MQQQEPLSPPKRPHASELPLTKGDVANVVANGRVCVFQFQGRLSVAEEHLWGCVTGPATLLELLSKTKQM